MGTWLTTLLHDRSLGSSTAQSILLTRFTNCLISRMLMGGLNSSFQNMIRQFYKSRTLTHGYNLASDSIGQCLNTWQSAHLAVLLCSSPPPCFLTSLYIEFAWDHVTTAQLRDLASPIYGHIEAFTGFTWPRDQSRELISRGTDTRVCNGCNVCSITHPHSSAMWALPMRTAWWPWIINSKIAQFDFDEFCSKMYVMQCFWGRWTRWKCPFPPKI